ncbi:FAD-dependent oxidoreductase [Roseomonas populi]|uniref:Thioredoxin reductase n=1 Tax=Roseomonas populi TaxID=3121582 RepID=A0ABT1XAB2_9PROT|nr:FAD-dependent oxidoreductase [Roseomonas pecuniae]MCR0985048.1 FAD-dependent oxidoreductase [Roseomonas pecuniae]
MTTLPNAAAAFPDPADPYRRTEQIFPRLTDDMVRRATGYGRIVDRPEGGVLYSRGNRIVDFFIVLEGAIEVLALSTEDGKPDTVLTVHGQHGFTGELDLLNGRETLVSARAQPGSRLLRIDRPHFHRMLQAEADIAELAMRAFILRRMGFIQHGLGGVILLGASRTASFLGLQRFLGRNGYPHEVVDIDRDPQAQVFVSAFGLRAEQLPVVILPGHKVLYDPGTAALADTLGLTEEIAPEEVFDVAVVGAGPAGLASAVYAASEGLRTIVIEGLAPGGQAGTSSRIENYLGFPTGITGQALAGRAQIQAQKFGARLAISRMVKGLDCSAHPYRLALEDGRSVTARAVVVASGARYRKLNVPDYERFEGQGIHYAATAIEGRLCPGEEVIVVGGGNSAGQAAMFLSRIARRVHMLVRAEGLAATMSDYLVQRIASTETISLRPRSTITGLGGAGTLEEVTWFDGPTGRSVTRPVRNVFAMIGAEPNTAWLGSCLSLDGKGFVVTGRDADGAPLADTFASSRPGIYAVGDVRSSSTKRVASAVGEGSVVVQSIHRYLGGM